MAYIFVILKNIIYGSSILFTASLLESTDVLDVLSIRFLLSSIVLLLLIAFKIIKVNFKGKALKLLVITAIFEPVLEFIFESIGIMHSSNITVAIISAGAPILSCVVQFLILREKTNFMQTICIALGIGGVLYIVLNTTSAGGKDTPIGMIFMFLAVLAGALYGSFSRKTAMSGEFSSWDITCFSAFAGAIAFNSANIVRHLSNGTIANYFTPLMDGKNLIGFLFLSVACTVVAMTMNNMALAKLEPIRIAAFAGVTTIVTIIEGILINGEKLRTFHVIGGTFIILCVFGVNYFATRGKNPFSRFFKG